MNIMDDRDEPVEELYKVLKEKEEELRISNMVKESCEREVKHSKMVIRDQAAKIDRQEAEIAVLRAENNDIRLELESLRSYINTCRFKYDNFSLSPVPAFDKNKADNRIKGFFKENRQINHSRKTFESTTEK
jgi:predicted RNase H-like nuclease (RuvC/YqgF family)